MTCPICGGSTKVTHTIDVDDEAVMRYRQCTECHYKFKTLEYEEDLINHLLEDKNDTSKT